MTLQRRWKRLTGPCRETDAEIAVLVGDAPTEAHQNFTKPQRDHGEFGVGSYGMWTAPSYTASLDAAMTLVPEGLQRLVRDPSPTASGNKTQCYAHVGWLKGESHADTMPLALTAAALRARAALLERSS